MYITINKFHEKKRRIEYAGIKRKLNIPDEEVVIIILNIISYQLNKKKKKNKNIVMKI